MSLNYKRDVCDMCFNIPHEISFSFIDHWLIVHHVCVVAQSIIREHLLIFN